MGYPIFWRGRYLHSKVRPRDSRHTHARTHMQSLLGGFGRVFYITRITSYEDCCLFTFFFLCLPFSCCLRMTKFHVA